MPESDFPSKWEKAIRHFEQALSIRAREKDPERHAAILQNLGTAYRELKTGNRAANIRRAVRCYCQAMRSLHKPAASRRWADLHHDLGNAYLTLASSGEERSRNILRAIRHLDRALTVRTKVQSQFNYAATQLSRGEAFLQWAVIGFGGISSLEKAHACFDEARIGFTQCAQTDLAAAAQKRLDFITGSSGEWDTRGTPTLYPST